MDKNVIVYKTKDDVEPFLKWLFALRDKITRHRIETRIERIRQGITGIISDFMEYWKYD